MDYRLIYLTHMFIVAPIFIYPFIAEKLFGVNHLIIILLYY